MPEAVQHLVRSYEQELAQLRGLIVQMGGIVESQFESATKAVIDRDAEAATKAVEADPKVDALERDIEQFVIRLLALRQPMAGDLRLIIGALKASDDLERIGDYAANVAKRSIVLARHRRRSAWSASLIWQTWCGRICTEWSLRSMTLMLPWRLRSGVPTRPWMTCTMPCSAS